MKVSWKVSMAAGTLAGLWMVGVALAARPAAQEQPRMRESIVGKKAGVYFKNVSTSTLKELSVDDFIGAMGVMTDALGLDCADCHPNAGSDQVDWVFDTARKKTARRMVEMVGNLNKEFFGGAQRVTCWTCHHGRVTPATSIQLNKLYEAPNDEVDDFVARDSEQPAAAEILDKYIAAIGGAQKWAAIRNYVATGSSIGFGGFGGDGQFEIFANAPESAHRAHPVPAASRPRHQHVGLQRHAGLGQHAARAARELRPDRRRARRRAARSPHRVPGQHQGRADQLAHGLPACHRRLRVPRGAGQRTARLGRHVLYRPEDVPGEASRPLRAVACRQRRRSDRLRRLERDVNGVKLPFEYSFFWLDGRYTAKIKDYKFNTTIDPTDLPATEEPVRGSWVREVREVQRVPGVAPLELFFVYEVSAFRRTSGLVAMRVRHSEAVDRIAFEVELDHHDRFLAHHPAVVPRLDGDNLRRLVLDDAAVGVLDVDFARARGSRRARACRGRCRSTGFMSFGPVEARRINHPLHARGARAPDVEPDMADEAVRRAADGG